MLNNTFNKNAKLGDMDNLYHLYLGKAGSHAYGTNTPTSDDDFRGIFVASREFLTTPYYHRGEYSDPKQKDHKSYEIAKFIKLYTDGNPNIVELLWIDESDILHSTPQYELLRKHRYDLLSSKLAFSFTGYALSQLKAMKNQSKWENNPQSVTPPRQIDYVNMVVNFTIDKLFRINLEDYYNHHRLVHYGGNVYGLYNETGYSPFNENTFSLNVNAEEFEHTTPNGERKTPKFIVKFNIDEYKRDLDVWTKYWEWRNLKNKKITLYTLLEHELLARSSNSVHEDNLVDECSIETVVEQDDMSSFIQTLKSNVLVELVHTCKRHFDFKQEGTDLKNGMHLVRLMKMGVEILRDGVVNVKRPDAAELLAIRNGSWSYDELVAFGEEQERVIREVYYPQTKLPKKANIQLATKLLLQIQDEVWFK